MLEKLYIENIAVIERAELELSAGFTVLTGETGAGKSILIDSINLLLGQRTSRELVRQGTERGFVSAVFTNINPEALAVLAEEHLELSEGQLVISREVSADGRSAARINSRPVSVALLKKLGNSLVDIHGQHDNQFLLSPENHIGFLDEYAGVGRELSGYQTVYRRALELKRRAKALQERQQTAAQRHELLSFQAQELADAQLKAGEEELLKQQQAELSNAAKLLESARLAYQCLYSEEGTGASDLTAQALEALSGTEALSGKLKAVQQKLLEVCDTLNDATAELGDYLENESFDGQTLEEVEERLALYQELKRKYGMSVEELLEYQRQITKELGEEESEADDLREIRGEMAKLQGELKTQGGALSKKRRDAAHRLEREIARELSFLDMPKVIFKVFFEETGEKIVYTATGYDKVEFLIATNQGEAPKPLVKIASGGELSRIMLALKSILKSRQDADTLIFDEIDTGVSGKTAQKIGMKMQRIAEEAHSQKQVICVTHLAQIAALANHHILIEKKQSGGRASTVLKTLDYDGRKQELARIISGIEITPAALQTAAEMLTAARQGN